MKTRLILGILIAGLGGFILVRGLNYGYQRNDVRVGELQVSIQETRPIPPWVGGVVLAGGLLLLGSGFRTRRAA
jgi:hypothetical protein